jgi:uncharacterized protein YndB with AHSA1/START domain
MTDSQIQRSGRGSLVASLRLAEGKGVVQINDCLDASIRTVWSALVAPERLACWLGRFEGQLQVGGDFRARFFASEWEGMGRIEVCEPHRHLMVSLIQTDSTESHAMEVKLEARGEQTLFVVEERGIPPQQLAAYGAGVQVHVEDLVTYLVGGDRCDAQARWKELFSSYQSKSIDPA